MACLPPTYKADKKCNDAEAPSVVEQFFYADFDAFKAAIADGNITITDNVFGGFAGTDPSDKIFYPVATGMKFDMAPTATSVVTGAGMNKFGQTAIGQITEPKQAEEILQSGQVDVILIGRASLRDPYWPLRAAHELGAEVGWPPQYERGVWPKATNR
jgi:hypothetical protein